MYCGRRAALYCMNYISLSLEYYHSIMLNTITHLDIFQDGRKIQNGRQIEDCSHIYIHIVRQLSKIMGTCRQKTPNFFDALHHHSFQYFDW